MFCDECGKKLPDDAKFCIYCGNKMARSASEKSPPHGKKMKAHRTRSKLPIALATAGAFIVIIGGLLVVVKPWETLFPGRNNLKSESTVVSSIEKTSTENDDIASDEVQESSQKNESLQSLYEQTATIDFFDDSEIIDKYFTTIVPESTAEETPSWDDIRGSLTASKNPSGYRYYPLGDGTIAIEQCRKYEEEIVIPETIDSYPVSKLRGGSVFAYAYIVKKIVIPDSVLSVGPGTFNNTPHLTTIEVSESHPTMRSIDGVLFSKGGGMLLAYPQAKENAVYCVPEGTRKIGNYSFHAHFNFPSVEKVILPNSVRSIGRYAFADCVDLKKIELPDELDLIGDNAVKGCDSLTT